MASAADVAVLDLEDACPAAERPAARLAVRDLIARPRDGLIYVRVNGAASGLLRADLEAVVGEGLDGVVLAKAERAADIAEAEQIIGMIEPRHGLPEGRIEIVPLVEGALGLVNARSIAGASRRVRRLAFGSVDFALDVGMHPGPDEIELAPHRAALVLASRVERLEPPIDGVWLATGDDEGLARTARRARAEGFQGKLCIHPGQIEAVAAAFVPTPVQIDRARRIVQAFAAAAANGAAAIKVDGDLVDYPVVRQAERLLASVAGAENP